MFAIYSTRGLLLGRTDDEAHARRCCDLWFNAAVVVRAGKIVYRKYQA